MAENISGLYKYEDLIAVRLVIDGTKRQDLVRLFHRDATLSQVLNAMLLTGNDTLVINGGQAIHSQLFHADMKTRK